MKSIGPLKIYIPSSKPIPKDEVSCLSRMMFGQDQKMETLPYYFVFYFYKCPSAPRFNLIVEPDTKTIAYAHIFTYNDSTQIPTCHQVITIPPDKNQTPVEGMYALPGTNERQNEVCPPLSYIHLSLSKTLENKSFRSRTNP